MGKFEKIIVVRTPDDNERVEPILHTIGGWGNKHNVPVCTSFPKDPEKNLLIVSIGGDGTMLKALRHSLDHDECNVIGFNAGTLGFLAEDHSIEEFVRFLDAVYRQTEDVKLDQRTVLEGKLWLKSSTGKIKKYPKIRYAINEFVISPGTLKNPTDFEIFINGNLAAQPKGCGVIVSTATGSTAMALSSGGAIVNPSTKTIQIIPLISHTLTSRPIITTGRDMVEVKAQLSSRIPGLLTLADGQEVFKIDYEDEQQELILQISRSEKVVSIWRPKDWNFFEVLSTKLKWG